MEKNKKIANFFINFFLLIFSLAFFCFLAEISCRLFYDESANYDELQWEDTLLQIKRDEDAKRKPDREKIFINKENGLMYNIVDNKIYSNRYAQFNLNEITKSKENGKYRIAILGDSFSCYGGLLNFDESFTRKLPKALNTKNILDEKKIKEFEVLPFCLAGINTYQELALLKELVLEYNPDMLILQFTDNDVGPARTEFLDWEYGATRIYLQLKTDAVFVAYRFVPTLPFLNKKTNVFLFERSSFIRFISYKLNLARTNRIVAAIKEEKSGEQVSLESINEMSRLTKGKEIPFLLFYFRNPSIPCDENKQLGDSLKVLSEKSGIHYFNMCDYVRDIYSLRSSLDAGHYGAQGHQIAVDVLVETILKLVEAGNGE